ncbi:MAG: IclR family transcriptional regulator [Parvibaculaceae bacterium]|nr:IclR family transcriptional regulator [Parvibaculaceae bacterium]
MESVKTALRVLELVAEAGEIGVSELARRAGEPKTTIQRNLLTLHEAGWIRSVDEGARRKWTLSAKLVVLAARVEAFPHLREVALPVMEALRHQTQETIHLTLREGGQVVLIERLDSPQALRTFRALGSRAPLHATANGKAVLARVSDAERERYLAQSLKVWTPHTLTDPQQLAKQLLDICAQGYAFSDGELDVNVRAVASAICPRGGAPVAALSISCPATRLPDDHVRRYGALVKKAARQIEEQLDGE